MIVAGAISAGCASLLPGTPDVQNGEPISVVPSQSAGYDYLVVVHESRNLGFDPNDQKARDEAALAKLKSECDTPRIIGETVVKADAGLGSNQGSRYEIKVRC
jgi:hypothetical protein